ncbi:peptidylprolyl isomerase [Dokdonella soli]|uniref:Peptidyl-prolyl cis-trans isomerase n=1 Tax=Dokdonella soli TaxID=529810 RepID=A0ABN1IC08_9GAMM
MFRRLLLALALIVPTFAFAQTTAPAKPATTKAAAKATKPAAKAPAKPVEKPAATDAQTVASKVLLKTSMGDITLQLYPDKAPKSVENFLAYVKSGFYDGTIFHRVIGNFMIQGGGFTKDLRQKSTKAPVVNESKNGLSNLRGTLAMARTQDPNSATAQFFINTVDNPRLDYTSDASPGYCVFGKVVTGLDVVDKIRAVETGPQGPFRSDVPVTPVVIEKVTLAP